MMPGHLHRGGGTQVSWDEHPVSGAGAASDLHPREINHRPLNTERHWGRVIRVRDQNIAGPWTEVDINVPGNRDACLAIIGANANLESGETA